MELLVQAFQLCVPPALFRPPIHLRFSNRNSSAVAASGATHSFANKTLSGTLFTTGVLLSMGYQ